MAPRADKIEADQKDRGRLGCTLMGLIFANLFICLHNIDLLANLFGVRSN